MPTGQRSFPWVCVARMMMVCASAATALQGQTGQQPQPRGYVVSGTVADREGNPIPDADVALVVRDSSRRTVRSAPNGRFRMEEIDHVPVTLRVRRLGFQGKDVVVEIPGADRTASVFVQLDPSVTGLNPVEVNDDAEKAFLDPRLAEFRARRATSKFARFVDEEMITAARATFLSEVLRKVPGVIIKPGAHAGNAVRMRNCAGSQYGDRGAPLLWVDGIREPGAELDEMVRVADVAGIEIYASLAGVPAAYFDRTASCGTILVWTKSR